MYRDAKKKKRGFLHKRGWSLHRLYLLVPVVALHFLGHLFFTALAAAAAEAETADLLFALLAYVTANLKQEIICCKAEEV
jgi:hypothetical protein